jgi:phosphotransferase system enzyme I (PtsI)
LIQYTLAIDRGDASVAHLYDELHPAVLKLIAQTIRVGRRARTPVSVCGELAGELAMAELLLGMGLRQFSMHPSQILPMKEHLQELSVKASAKLAARVLRQNDPLKIRASLASRRVADRSV